MYEHRVIDLHSRNNTQCTSQAFSQPPAPRLAIPRFAALPSSASHVAPYPTSQASRWVSQGSQDYSAPLALRECQLSLPQATPLPHLATSAARIATPAPIATAEDAGGSRACLRRHTELCEALLSFAKSTAQTQTSSAEVIERVVAGQQRLLQEHQQTHDALQHTMANLTRELHRVGEAVATLCAGLARDRHAWCHSRHTGTTCEPWRRVCRAHDTRSTKSTRHRATHDVVAHSRRRSGNVVTLSRSMVRGQPSASSQCCVRPASQKQRADTTVSADVDEPGCTSSTRRKVQCSRQCASVAVTSLAPGNTSMLGAMCGSESDECDLFFT